VGAGLALLGLFGFGVTRRLRTTMPFLEKRVGPLP